MVLAVEHPMVLILYNIFGFNNWSSSILGQLSPWKIASYKTAFMFYVKQLSTR